MKLFKVKVPNKSNVNSKFIFTEILPVCPVFTNLTRQIINMSKSQKQITQ